MKTRVPPVRTPPTVPVRTAVPLPAADTGSAMLSGRILVDQYMNSADTCMEYGVRKVDVYVLEDLDAHSEID